MGQPRDSEERATYMILDAARRVLTIHRVPYDIEAVRMKTRRAGLAPRLIAARIISVLRRGMRRLRLVKRSRSAAH